MGGDYDSNEISLQISTYHVISNRKSFNELTPSPSPMVVVAVNISCNVHFFFISELTLSPYPSTPWREEAVGKIEFYPPNGNVCNN